MLLVKHHKGAALECVALFACLDAAGPPSRLPCEGKPLLSGSMHAQTQTNCPCSKAVLTPHTC